MIQGRQDVRDVHRGLSLMAVLLAAFLMCLPAAAAQSQEKEKPKESQEAKEGKDKESKDKESKDKKEESCGKELTTRLRIEVTGGEKSVPVDSASVYVKYPQERTLAKDRMVELNLKTNREGVARLNTAPRGKVLIQIIAPGWKTFGQWYDLEHEEQTIKINLQKPPRWY